MLSALLMKLRDVRKICRHCGAKWRRTVSGPYHGGFCNVGVAYCDGCGRSLSFPSIFSEQYRRLVGEKHAWTLRAQKRMLVESMFVACDVCGGSFRFSAPPRCPECREPIHYLLGCHPNSTMYLRVEPALDEEEGDVVWRADDISG